MASYSEIQAGPYTIWKHIKTNSLYVVVGVAWDSTNGNEDTKYIVYVSQVTGLLRVREASEFLDGRFEPVGFSLSNEELNSSKDDKDPICKAQITLPDGRRVRCGSLKNHQGMHIVGDEVKEVNE